MGIRGPGRGALLFSSEGARFALVYVVVFVDVNG